MTINSNWSLFENQVRGKGKMIMTQKTLNTNKTKIRVTLTQRRINSESILLDIIHVTWDCTYILYKMEFSGRQLLNKK